ncbi:tRNA (adenosine(37)-N6)-dimethylallyltransferase MiaA [Abyssalbus ytuae]|uniref:tRNA dimethylallyltransferase n=1 Tax=Abyssalbus ytuae TaxID=2926907 RepID=A0A9E6ZKX6_9FLAO|nr:tRNA (adenosine(37)-N6)-dimethylallyltransferase MiaA [Abyssalbus ytuae]UOB17657.1 tRNA (adenosine(37)-N6)-dimethylallyltransferase MiaA [Abyssalbus ytuae]
MQNIVLNADIIFMSTKYLITVVGPTAIGKTSLAIKLAQYYNTEIISSDSRQFFKEMKIGTAVPNPTELATVPHYFIQHKSIFDYYSVGEFEREAIKKLENLFKQYNVVVMAGGSGLYVDAVIKGLDDFPDIDNSIRENLNEQLKNNGLSPLQSQLKKLDPVHYTKIDINNPQRVIRALEICIGTGEPYSGFLTDKSAQRNFNSVKIGLTAEREIIYDRINKRVDLMIDEGLIDEAKSLYSYKHLNALQTVGYKELFNYFDGTWTLDFAISEIKKNTRRFAKRQLTWFNKDKTIMWFDYSASLQEILDELISL